MSQIEDMLDAPAPTHNFRCHPEREKLLDERHARPFVPLEGEWDIAQYTFMLEDEQKRHEPAHLLVLLQASGQSVEADIYYVTSLIGYALKGAKTLGSPVEPTLRMALAVPFVAGGL
ncbi:DUF3422 family protein [Pseudovibrio sp. Tun.PSC04-5.I4]|uniref:DUF3422 family protein n=1 Tax=Pseudovibrio sp. Tun.PSC04-5.I4 TaxID=1798213 RepID=UPI000B1C9641|nr:DUF3422 family protein [Pseudovibrio sp. Tun.PSC04-5.I4]